MAKRGRPVKYTPDIGGRLVNEMAKGFSLDAASVSCGISPRTAYNWCRTHPEFLHAIEEGRAASLLFWEKRAIALAGGKSGNAQLVSLALRNRSRSPSGWDANTSRLEVSGPSGAPIQLSGPAPVVINARDLTIEQRENLKAILIAAKQVSDNNEVDG
jgi:hypothetical protein